ncbi:hypothetical protein GCM10025865_00900 [Paraoerskovia sediminicola]|uniref:Uncharacterized protein n=1 Tax=Paraoerskovia sediminicola TaxID=1138587 RepID=A0ABN6X7V2_9CELL|nr:hypothetical protein [Paraoerskovia sediminicola]BDZ40791.1 hypothetical protein GCM10025865_00900 [Paraoerskovia sediminicola]
MDLTESIAPRSDQINAEDLLTGPRTFTIDKVDAGSPEQPVNVHLIELPGRPYRPSKSMRRIMVDAWGKEAADYAGHRMTLYRDPEVTFGRDKVGGIKISHLSHIDRPRTVALTVTRGKRAPHIVQPLPDAPTEPTADDVAACDDVDTLKGMWRASSPERRAQIEARVAELTARPDAPQDAEVEA